VKLTKTVFAGLALASFGFVFASEEAPDEHKKWMKDLGSNVGALRKGVDVEQNAKAIETTMAQVGDWWKARNSEVAMKSSNDTIAGAQALAKAASGGDKEAITAGMKAVNAGCKACHDQHREKIAENVYKIK
jgi:Cytochrome C'